MADMFDEEPHGDALPDHDHDDATHDPHDPVREMPSDYEFSDDHGARVTDAADIEDPDAALADGEEPVAAERRSVLLPVAAAVGGIVLLGGVAWWQFAPSHNARPPVAMTVAATPALPRPIAAQPAVVAAQPVAVQPVAAQPATVQPATIQPATIQPVVAPAAPVSPDTTVSAAPAAPFNAPATPIAATPIAAMPAVAGTNAPGAPAASAQAALARTMAADSAAEQQKLTALDTRIDALQDAMDKATRQLGEVSNMVAATVGNSNSAAETSKQLQQRLDTLEQQLAQLRAQPVRPVRSAPVIRAPAVADTDAAMPAPRHHARHVRHDAAPKKIVTASISGTLDGNDRPAATPWVLRAAAPGQAYVSATATSSDLKPLHVGDSLPGIGQVTAIRQDGGSWIVQGTKGIVR